MTRHNWSEAHQRIIVPNQEWLTPKSILTVRVMAVAQGYAMVRFKGCIPHVVYIKDMADWRLAPGKSAATPRETS